MNLADPLHPPYARHEHYNVMEFCSRMWQRRAAIFLWGAFFTVLAGIYQFACTKPYTAEALVRVDADTNQSIASLSKGPDINLDSEMDFIRSRSMFLQALNQLGPTADMAHPISWSRTMLYRLGLDQPRVFSSSQPGLVIDALQVPERLVNQKLSLYIGQDHHFTLRDAQNRIIFSDTDPAPLSGVRLQISRMDAAAGQTYTLIPRSAKNVPLQLQHQLKTETEGRSARSGFIRISFASDNAEFSKRFLTALVDTYLKRAYEQSAQTKLQAITRLDAQLADVKIALEKAEADVKDFQLTSGVIDMTAEMQSSLQQVMEIETQIRALKAKQKELNAYYTAAHPSQLSVTEQLRYLEAEYRHKQGIIDRLPETQRQLLHYKREVETQKQTYAQTSEKLTQLRNEAASITGYAKLIDEPEILPGAGLTNFVKNLILSFLAGCCVGGLVMYVQHFSPLATLSEAEQITDLTDLPILGKLLRLSRFEALVRTYHWRSNLPLIRSDSDANLFEDFLSLMKNLAFASYGAPNPVLMISSQKSTQAASIVAMNVATLYARMHTTLLIDCSMQAEGLHPHFSVRSAPGLSDVLVGSIAFEKAVHTLAPNFDFLPSGTVTSYGAPLLHQAAAIDLLTSCAASYKSIVLYCPSLNETQTKQALVNYVGALVFVVSAGEKIERLRRFLAHFTAYSNVKGIILDVPR